jgi:AbrB family looped-hinge helix DNA binding protein
MTSASHTAGEVTLGTRGRLVLPAAIRAELELEAGERLIISVGPEGVTLRPLRSIAEHARGLLAGRLSPGAVDQLVAERRAEAEAE